MISFYFGMQNWTIKLKYNPIRTPSLKQNNKKTLEVKSGDYTTVSNFQCMVLEKI